MDNTTKIVSSFYKYAKIEAPLKFQHEQLELCKSLGLKGRIMVGKEGINGSVYGFKDNVERYKSNLRKNNLFSDVDFKEQETNEPAFRKLFVRIRKEIVNSGLKVDFRKRGHYITPAELKEELDKNNGIVLLDIRNNYETRIGKFKNARTLNIKNFREFPKSVKEIEDLKNKKIVTYCTGGIRCEKASAFLKENRFKNVFQLKGGILKFCEQFPDTYWEGKCFVFDDRLTISLSKNNHKTLTNCVWCNKKCDDYINCHNIDCDKLFISCEECKEKYDKSCCERCAKSEKRRKAYA